jgi:hypothetical protein
MLFNFTRVSRNRKTGPIPVVTASKDTCPSTCPLMGKGCYAEHGPLALQWEKCMLTLHELCSRIRRLPKRQLWRYGQAGDLPVRTEEIEQLARANGRRPVICYTHHRNFDAIRRANELGFHINISADNFDEADSFARQGLSTVMVLPSEYGRGRKRGSWAESLEAYRKRISNLPRKTMRRRQNCNLSGELSRGDMCGMWSMCWASPEQHDHRLPSAWLSEGCD